MHAGHWDKATHKSIELSGRTIGLIGLGAIGRKFARMVDALDMRVLGFDPFARDLPDHIIRRTWTPSGAKRTSSRSTAR
ncbi:hypothetical protein BCC0238_007219 (plasmid) [Burkholderia gladioli]